MKEFIKETINRSVTCLEPTEGSSFRVQTTKPGDESGGHQQTIGFRPGFLNCKTGVSKIKPFTLLKTR